MFEQLLELAKDLNPGQKMVHYEFADLRNLCAATCDMLVTQPILLELEAPIKIIGDIHGQFWDLLRIFDKCGWPHETSYVFLGNYTNFGKFGIETMCLLCIMKLKFADSFFLLRGNHECEKLTALYGFQMECRQRYGSKVWQCFLNVFNYLPVAAIISDSVFCVHGGLSEN